MAKVMIERELKQESDTYLSMRENTNLGTFLPGINHKTTRINNSKGTLLHRRTSRSFHTTAS